MFCASSVNLLGKHPTVLTYHSIGHFQRKNKNWYDLTTTAIKVKATHK